MIKKTIPSKPRRSGRAARRARFALLILPAFLAFFGATIPAAASSAGAEKVPPAEGAAAPGPVDAERQREAVALIERRGHRVTLNSLGQAAAEADVELVRALLDVGMDPSGELVGGPPLGRVAGMGCVGYPKVPVADRLATIDLLVARGARTDWRDAGGNSLLFMAMHCPRAVVEKLVAAGVDPTAVGQTGFGPLNFALANARWDTAEFLVDAGARLTQEQADQIFFEPPTDPEKLEILRRATTP